MRVKNLKLFCLGCKWVNCNVNWIKFVNLKVLFSDMFYVVVMFRILIKICLWDCVMFFFRLIIVFRMIINIEIMFVILVVLSLFLRFSCSWKLLWDNCFLLEKIVREEIFVF